MEKEGLPKGCREEGEGTTSWGLAQESTPHHPEPQLRGEDGPRVAAPAQQVSQECRVDSYLSQAISKTWCPRI